MLSTNLTALGVALTISAVPIYPAIAQGRGITVVAAEFGSLGAKRKLDIAQPLRRLCGDNAPRCDVFCSETSFGRYALGRRPICRVSYRCPDGSTRGVEAAREELIMLRCQDEADAGGPMLQATGSGQ